MNDSDINKLYRRIIKDFKALLIIYGIENDYFGYGSYIIKRKDGKYKYDVDTEKYCESLTKLSQNFDELSNTDKLELIEGFIYTYLLEGE